MKLDGFYRRLPLFKGKTRLAGYIFNRDRSDVLVNTKYGNFRLPNLKDFQYFEIYCKGFYEPELVKYIIETLPQNGCLLDIGANIGSIAIPVGLARPDAKIISVEALPHNFNYLQENLKINGLKNIIPLNVCFSNDNGKLVRLYHHKIRLGSTSFHSLHSKDFVELVTKTLDQQLKELSIDKVDMLKIDTEGSEALIFRGASDLLHKSKPIVLFEFNESYENAIEGLHAGAAQQILIDAGYKIFEFDHYSGRKPLTKAVLKGTTEFLAIYS
jgi:FkbM family methyltransferase